MKDLDERADRWLPPLRPSLLLAGFQLDPDGRALPLPATTGPRMEFLGDS